MHKLSSITTQRLRCTAAQLFPFVSESRDPSSGTSKVYNSHLSMEVCVQEAKPPPTCPKEPGPNDCCQQGCKVCVWDNYRNKLQKYVDYMQQHHPGVPVPDVSAAAAKQQQAMMQASMDAFEQLERQLQQR